MGPTDRASNPSPAPAREADVSDLAAHAVFERVAARFPDRTAAVCAGDRVTYRELDAWADAVAAALLDAGVAPEERVALAVPRSIAQVAGVLGVLKAGAAYVPVVTNQPPDRLRRIVTDAACRCAVATPGYASEAIDPLPVRVDPGPLRRAEAPAPRVPVRSDNLAYVMYTSGSTGRPKGAMIEHAGVVRLVHGQDYMPFGPDLHFLYAGPLSFDLSTIEIFTPLLHGAALLISTDEVLTPDTVRALAETERLRAVCVSFSLFRALFDADPGAFDRVPVIGVCGEPADPRFIRRAQQRLPHARFYNAYGPTECTALSTTHQIPSPCPLDPPVVPIGKPLERMAVRIVGPDGAEAPPGEPGELWISGVGLARGYLNDPELTAARFVTGPDGRRAYRSGDLVRRLPDGSLAYLGRIDDQIKIRGQRIELGEIEAALSADPAVRAAAAAVAGKGDRARVVACVVPADPASFDAAAVRERAAGLLTAAMLPATVVPVDAIPFNHNGKADRAAIAALADRAPDPALPTEPAEGPATEHERLLLAALDGLADPATLRPDRSLTACGGSSLTAMALRMRLRERAGVDLPVPDLLAAPSLRAIAAMLETGTRSAPHTAATATAGPVALSPAQRRLWTIQQIDPSNAAYNVAYRFDFDAPPDPAALEAAWADLHDRHPALRTLFRADDAGEPTGTLLQAVRPRVEWSVPLNDPARLRAEITRPFDLADPPPTRLLIADDAAWAVVVMHHAVTDAWSMEVALRDLDALYRARRDRAPHGLPTPGPGMPAHAAARLADARSPETARLAADAAAPFADRAPTTAPRAADAPDAITTTADLPPETLDRLARLAEHAGVPLQAAALAAFAAWAGPLCRTDRPAIGLAVSTRDEGPFADAVGFFVETVPVLLPAAEPPEPAARAAGAAVRRAHALRRIPFDLLARAASGPARGRTPITEVFFNWIDRAPIAHPPAPPGPPAIRPVLHELDHGLARFDLLATVYRDGPAARLAVTARRGVWDAEPPTAPALAAFLDAWPTGRASPAQHAPDPAPTALPDTPHASTTADDPLTALILATFREVLADPSIGPHDDFFKRGGDSLRAVRAFGQIRQHQPTHLNAAAMFRAATASDLAATIRAAETGANDRTFIPYGDPAGARAAYLFPGVTGDALSMRRVIDGLGPGWSAHAAAYPGAADARPPVESLAQLVEALRAGLDAYDPALSAFIGYSFGGVVAFELARRLQADGRAPALLVLADTQLLARFPSRQGRMPIAFHLEKFRAADWPGRLRYLRTRARNTARRVVALFDRTERYDALPEVRRVATAHLRAIRGYRPSGPYDGRTLIVRATGAATEPVDPDAGWGPWLTRPPERVALPCDHVALIKSDAALDLAAAVARAAP